MDPIAAHTPTVLIVDDEPATLEMLDRTLRKRGYQTVPVGDPNRARELMGLVPLDAIVTDLALPLDDGRIFASAVATEGTVPVVVVTGHHDLVEVSTLLDGAMPRAVLPKPLSIARLTDTLARILHAEQAAPALGDVTRELAQSMARALALRDVETEAHARRVALWTRLLACEIGMRPEDVYWAELGALLHDVGKIGVPDAILKKPGPLDEAEWTIMRRHSEHGAQLLAPIRQLARARDVVLHHHESWDGAGYPCGLAGEAIPLAARVFSPVDAYDAMTSDRPYRAGMPHAEAMARIEAGAGRQFDPKVVATLRAIDETRWRSVRAAVDGRIRDDRPTSA